MRNKRIAWLVAAACIALYLAMDSYHGGPWRGTVIDAETKQPIEGAAVVAVWSADFGLSPAGPLSYYLLAVEDVTDKNGMFEFASQTFMNIPLAWEVQGPKLTIFKPGYGSFPEYQVSPSPGKSLPRGYFERSGAMVVLPNITSHEKRLKALNSAESVLDFPKGKIQDMFKLINAENKSIGFKGYKEAE